MIPLKLKLHNFMCYRDPAPLDFSGLHLACLSGNNGHGKSAILDAMTWALWGRARSNQADDLIHLGESDMWVDFEFALGPNRYRIQRSRERKGRTGKSDLQLQIWSPNGDGGEFQPITEPTLRETEQRIVDLLHMDFETFVNSAYLVQGRADEFTVKPPNQRKQILADILGLGVYDEYESRAKERVRLLKQECATVDGQIAGIDSELAREPQYVQDLQAAQAQVIELGDRLRVAEHAQRELQAVRQDLAGKRRALEDAQLRLQRGEREIVDLQDQLQSSTVRLAGDQALMARREEIEQGYGRLQAARQANQSWNDKLAKQAELQSQRSRLDQQVTQARSRLEADQRVAEAELAQLEAQAERQALLAEQLAEAQAELAGLADQEQRQAEVQAQLQALREERAALHSQNQQLKAEMDEIKERLDLLAEAGAACPVCGQPLGQEERERVLADYRQQGQARGNQHRGNQARLRDIQAQEQAGDAAVAAIADALRHKARWQRQEAQAEAQLAQAERAISGLAAVQDRLDQLSTQLAAGNYAAEARSALAEVDARLAALGYDAAAHQQARDDLLTYEPYQDRYTQAQAAAARVDELQTRIEWLASNLEARRQALAADQAQRDQLAASLAGLPQVEADLKRQTAEVDGLADQVNVARQRFGAAQQRLDACRAQAARRQQLAAEIEALRSQQAIYEELQAAFSKKGLQAMIIEAAIPEIEAEANRLLGRMTDGRMSVRMETQRETKTTQEVRETLDIILSDELGSRDYSLYSGGEAFRANFAIRIALSKLLARRAGARLQTLIVDEGFGTQDAQGRERLVQAITSIQNDFERILVITHIDELKDNFPARIDVVKTDQGSQISVS